MAKFTDLYLEAQKLDVNLIVVLFTNKTTRYSYKFKT